MSNFIGEKMLQGEAEAAIEASDSDGADKLGYGDFLMRVEAEEGEEKERSLMDAFKAYEMEGKVATIIVSDYDQYRRCLQIC
ncbi:hypothetical protein KSP39_PZI008224 [Platanthera zijinensis]|uniref:Uncharacterized protein n=1 Tax=Platanthera zijinensis TaxID=2320716 RepID=A0AAP0BPV9_9ASPA